ncbi:sugar transferase [Halopenitus sp. H-Gu1]|uniref:sugar transferase n=1 Tax=Halopenitus sp. H-Gu1 TaxID=3242697 RepID=UPI00359DF760
MVTGWRYRLVSVLGVTSITALSVYTANLPLFQVLLTEYVPIVNRLDPAVLDSGGLRWALFISTVIVVGSFTKLFRPEPRRVLDVVFEVEKRVTFSVCAMATLGYFKWSHRLPRQTVIMTTVFLSILLPVFFVAITGSPSAQARRSVIVGNDPHGVERIVDAYDGPLLGYLAPPTPYRTGSSETDGGTSSDRESVAAEVTDGGKARIEVGHIGGLSRLEETIRDYDVDTAILAFDRVDRGEFFGALHTCHEHGVNVKTHVDHVDSLLVNEMGEDSPIVDVDLEPWDLQDRIVKRAFDVSFAATALLVLSPVTLAIAAAIKLEGNGPVLFSQDRTYRFGNTFTVYKFRTLKPEPEGEVGTTFDEDRQTRLGDFLRMTHLDEIPQLWSILVGDMSVVGPRPAQTDLEDEFEDEAATWKRRWFVKPGLTGLAQINDATSREPSVKIDYDVEYIRRQSFTFDVKIVLRQLWQVARDVTALRDQ